MNDILVSKIVGSPTNTSWAQASSTGRLYITLSLTSEAEKKIGAIGKEALEQLQREFFALDIKELSDIKNAVEKVTPTLESLTYSLVLAAITNDILYIITVGEGAVSIERDGTLADVAHGEEGKTLAFSGRLKLGDIIIIATQGFRKKISSKLLAEYTGSHKAAQIAEDIAPFIIEDATGEEAAILLEVRDPRPTSTPTYIPPQTEAAPETTEKNEADPPPPTALPVFSRSFIERLPIRLSKKRLVIILIVCIILVVLISLIIERVSEQNRAREELFSQVYTPNEQRLESARGLISLNRGRALEETEAAIAEIEAALDTFEPNSDYHTRLTTLLSNLKSLRTELNGGESIAKKTTVISAAGIDDLTGIDFVTVFDETIFVADTAGNYAVLTTDGTLTDTGTAEESGVVKITADDAYLYLLSDSVERIRLSDGTSKVIIPEASDGRDFAVFGSSVYLLTPDTITRYAEPNFNGGEYFNSNSPKNLSSFGIDGAVYILTTEGILQKYTRGTPDTTFKVDESVKLSDSSTLYSRENYESVYIHDEKNMKIIRINTDGNFEQQYAWSDLARSSSFAVSPDESAAYVVIDDVLYSFTL